jgi:hypothetical protein
MGLAVAGAAVAMTLSGGFSRSLHSLLGIATVVLGVLQVASTWFRGTHGGRYYHNAKPNDPATWFGDHYSMTLRRRIFEAFHKNVGYFAGVFAFGAVVSGLMQFPMPVLTGTLLAILLVIIVLCVALEFHGRRHDTYRSVFGTDPDHPYNKVRKDL